MTVNQIIIQNKIFFAEEESEDDEPMSCGIGETFSPKLDWFVSTIHKKSTILSVLYVIKDLLGIHPEKEITRKEFTESLKSLQRLNPNFGEILEEMNWTKLSYITKAVWCKYNNDRKKGYLTKYDIIS